MKKLIFLFSFSSLFAFSLPGSLSNPSNQESDSLGDSLGNAPKNTLNSKSEIELKNKQDVKLELHSNALNNISSNTPAFTVDDFFSAVSSGNMLRLKEIVGLDINNLNTKKDTNKGISKNAGLIPIKSIPSLRDDFGMTLLHAATNQSRMDIFELLINYGCDINVKDPRYGYTPLHSAVMNNNLNAVKILIFFGADIYAQDKEGVTPSQLATNFRNREILEYLQTFIDSENDSQKNNKTKDSHDKASAHDKSNS